MEEENEKEFQERDLNMPHVGTRVRRGPDWQWKNQDGRGPGTVVGHSERGNCSFPNFLFLVLTSSTIFFVSF